MMKLVYSANQWLFIGSDDDDDYGVAGKRGSGFKSAFLVSVKLIGCLVAHATFTHECSLESMPLECGPSASLVIVLFVDLSWDVLHLDKPFLHKIHSLYMTHS